jgi:hypothetical protein
LADRSSHRSCEPFGASDTSAARRLARGPAAYESEVLASEYVHIAGNEPLYVLLAVSLAVTSEDPAR